MTKEDIADLGSEIINRDWKNTMALIASSKHLISVYAGKNNSYYEELNNIPSGDKYIRETHANVVGILESFLRAVKSGLIKQENLKTKIRNEVESDILLQATEILSNKKFHPANAAMLIGAILENFLRSWMDSEQLELGNQKKSMNTYASILKSNNFITKQDVKDITSWAGIRNSAAHGNWEEVEDRSRINIMLESVNLFLMKYSQNI